MKRVTKLKVGLPDVPCVGRLLAQVAEEVVLELSSVVVLPVKLGLHLVKPYTKGCQVLLIYQREVGNTIKTRQSIVIL